MAAYLEVVNRRITTRFESARSYKSSLLNNSRQIIPAKDAVPSTFFRLNVVLMLLMLASIFSYLFLSNLLVSERYSLSLRKQKFNQLSAELTSESMQKTNRVDDLLSFVKASGMVEAKDINTVTEENGFALSGNRY